MSNQPHEVEVFLCEDNRTVVIETFDAEGQTVAQESVVLPMPIEPRHFDHHAWQEAWTK